ncbi:MAG: HlyD family efflux transporter periplasmic adaptor subunit [Eubacterium sp.]
MAKNKRVIRYKSPIHLNAGIVIFGLISIYLFINVVIYFTTERTNFYEVVSGTNSEEINKSYTGIAIRDEKIQYSEASGFIDYFVRENSRVSKNTTLYSIDSTGELNTLLSEINKKNSKLTDENISMISNLLYDFSNNFSDMDFSDVYDFKSSLKGTVVDLINMNSLQKLAKKSGDEFTINKSASSGIVLYRVDDYETLKPKKLKQSLFNKSDYTAATFSSGDKIDSGTPIYKTINDEEWSIAIQLSNAEAKKYKGKTGINIKFLKDGLSTTANFKIVKGADKKKYGIITLSKYIVRYASDRFIDIQILDDVTSGLKIPKTSLVSKKLYVIPKEYGEEGANSSDKIGFRLRTTENGKTTENFYYPTVAYSDDDNYYVSTSLFDEGAVLSGLETNEPFVIGRTQEFVGVYNINNGYTVFVRVKILDTTDEYYIVKAENQYGLTNYDRIVLDASQVSENQIVFQ